MNVVSVFDGIRCGYLALLRAGIIPENYFSSEIDGPANAIADKNFPKVTRVGDINFITGDTFKQFEIGLFIGGSPCQSFSRAGSATGFKGKSGLFWEYARLLRELKKDNPKMLFLLENVRMRREYQDIITKELGVEPIKINSKLVSAGNRDRLYWTNIEGVEVPEDKNIHINSVIKRNIEEPYYIEPTYVLKNGGKRMHDKETNRPFWRIPEGTKKGYIDIYPGQCVDLSFLGSKTRRGRAMFEKSNCITASTNYLCVFDGVFFRRFTVNELEAIQTLPKDYTAGVSMSQRKKAIGNGWNIDTVAHIFKYINR